MYFVSRGTLEVLARNENDAVSDAAWSARGQAAVVLGLADAGSWPVPDLAWLRCVWVQHGAAGTKGKDRGAEHIVTLGKGSFFGEGSLVYHRRVATVRYDHAQWAIARWRPDLTSNSTPLCGLLPHSSITACELLVWDFVHARAVMKRYPALWVKMKVIANRRRESVLFTRGGCVLALHHHPPPLAPRPSRASRVT